MLLIAAQRGAASPQKEFHPLDGFDVSRECSEVQEVKDIFSESMLYPRRAEF
jgi:hypothetical protein